MRLCLNHDFVVVFFGWEVYFHHYKKSYKQLSHSICPTIFPFWLSPGLKWWPASRPPAPAASCAPPVSARTASFRRGQCSFGLAIMYVNLDLHPVGPLWLFFLRKHILVTTVFRWKQIIWWKRCFWWKHVFWWFKKKYKHTFWWKHVFGEKKYIGENVFFGEKYVFWWKYVFLVKMFVFYNFFSPVKTCFW